MTEVAKFCVQAALLTSLAVGSVSCNSTLKTFQCTLSSDCDTETKPGTCQPSGLCSFEDDSCATGQRYGELAGEQSNSCVGEDRPADGGAIDGAPGCLAITNKDTLDLYMECEQLDSIRLINQPTFDATFPNLREVSGSIDIVTNQFTESINFPVLMVVGGDIRILSNDGLEDVNFPALVDLQGGLQVQSNLTGSVADFASLQAVAGDIEFVSNNELGTIALPRLLTVQGQVRVVSNPLLAIFDSPMVTQVDGDVTIQSNSSLCVSSSPVWMDVATGMVEISNNKPCL